MTIPVCKTFTYNNYAQAPTSNSMFDSILGREDSKRIEVELTYSDSTKDSICNRVIETVIKQNFYLTGRLGEFPPENLFIKESQKYPNLFFNEGVSRGKNSGYSYSGGIHTKINRYYTGCFDWDKAVDGNEYVRKLAAHRLPGLQPTPFIASQTPIAGTIEASNNIALTIFGVVAASAIAYGIYSLYKRCTKKAVN